MSSVKHYGKIKEEKSLEESISARDITQEIVKYGVSQYQIAKIIYLLALELEDKNALQSTISAIKPLLEGNLEKNSSNLITT